jgi:hypothetical protein
MFARMVAPLAGLPEAEYQTDVRIQGTKRAGKTRVNFMSFDGYKTFHDMSCETVMLALHPT